MRLFKCPVCHGTGISHCDNPDHGATGYREDPSYNCPGCGYSEDRSRNTGDCCCYCNGSGIIHDLQALQTEEIQDLIDDNAPDFDELIEEKVRCYDPRKIINSFGKECWNLNQIQWLIISSLPHAVHMRNFESAGLYVGYVTWISYEDYVEAKAQNGNILLEGMKYDFSLPLEIFAEIDDDNIWPYINGGQMIYDPTPEQIDELNMKKQALINENLPPLPNPNKDSSGAIKMKTF